MLLLLNVFNKLIVTQPLHYDAHLSYWWWFWCHYCIIFMTIIHGLSKKRKKTFRVTDHKIVRRDKYDAASILWTESEKTNFLLPSSDPQVLRQCAVLLANYPCRSGRRWWEIPKAEVTAAFAAVQIGPSPQCATAVAKRNDVTALQSPP